MMHKSRLEIGYEFARRGKFKEAAEIFEAEADSSYEGRVALARTYINLGRFEEGLAMFERNIKDMPNRPESYFRRGEVYALRGDHKSAIVDFMKSIRRRNEDSMDAVDAYLSIASSTHALCDESLKNKTSCIQHAVKFAERATELNPSRSDAFHLLGFLLVTYNPHLAYEYLKRAQLLSTTTTEHVLLLEDLARATIRMKDLNQSIDYVKQAFRHGSQNVALKFSLASELANAGYLKEASPLMKSALVSDASVKKWTRMKGEQNYSSGQCVISRHDFYLHPQVKPCSAVVELSDSTKIPFKSKVSRDLNFPSVYKLNKDIVFPVSHMYASGRAALVYDDIVKKPATTHARLFDVLRVLNNTNCGESTFYIAQAALELYAPELVKEFPAPQIPPLKSNMKKIRQRNIWMSRGGTHTPLHYDNYENLLLVLEGTKHVLMFEEKDHSKLYFKNRSEFTPRYEFENHRLVFDDQYDEQKINSNFAGINVTHPNFNLHPKYANAVPYFCSVNEGEILYIPRGWPHAVFSSPSNVSGWSYGVNWWF